MNYDVEAGIRLLQEIIEQQKQNLALTAQSGQLEFSNHLDEAVVAFEQLVAGLKRQLELTEVYNAKYTQPDNQTSLEPIVTPLANTLFQMADIREQSGQLARAEALREEAMQYSEKYLPDTGIAERERQRAASRISQGRFNEALVALAHARDLFQQKGKLVEADLAAADLAGIYEWLGDYERALVEVENISNILHEKLKTRQSEQTIWQSFFAGNFEQAQENARLMQINLEMQQIKGRCYRQLKRYDEAAAIFAQVIDQVPSVARLAIEYQQVIIQLRQGKYAETLNWAQKVEPHFTGMLRPKLGVLWFMRAEALLGLGQPENALHYIDRAITDLRQFEDPDVLWRMYWLKARICMQLNRPADALDGCRQSIDITNHLRRAPLGFRLDSTYLADKLPVYAEAIRLTAEDGDAAACLDLMESVKSRILTTALSIPRVAISAGQSELEQRVDQLSNQMDALDYQMYMSGSWTDEGRRQRAALETERAGLLERLRFSDPRWRNLTEPVPFDVSALSPLLAKKNQAALSLFFDGEWVTAVLVQDNACQAARQQLDAGVLSLLAAYLDNLPGLEDHPRAQPFNPKWFDFSAGLGVTADQIIPPALLDAALQAKELVISPHGSLHLLPWAGLLYQGKRLFQYCPVAVLPNLSCLPGLRADFPAKPKAALLGDPDTSGLTGFRPLPAAADELAELAGLYGPDGLVDPPCTGKDATQASFWRLSQMPGAGGAVFHVACHGKFEPGDPMNSGLMLSDGKLDAAEIARGRLPFSEVVLSACSTGQRPTRVQGVTLAGDEILGLPGAFLEAGVRSVLVSIPYAEDMAASQLMSLYHENRVDGMPPLPALQDAQVRMLTDPLFTSAYPPHLWIGFTLYGAG